MSIARKCAQLLRPSFFFFFLYLIIILYVIYVGSIGIFSRVSGQSYKPILLNPQTKQEKALVMANALTQALEEEMDEMFGWLPNDLFFVPDFIDNKTNYQRGIIYATRSASDMLAKAIAIPEDSDTVPDILKSATIEHFAYNEAIWGWLRTDSCEKKYRQGIACWYQWASLVDSDDANQRYNCNISTESGAKIVSWAIMLMEHCLVILNRNTTYFDSDNILYYAKGVCHVVDNVLRGLLNDYPTMFEHHETINEVFGLFDIISVFNPVYVLGGPTSTGDSMLTNHVTIIGQHIAAVSAKLTELVKTLEK